MLQSNFSAKSAILAQQQRLDIIANNLANVNTVGFKASRADFKDMIYVTMQRNEAPQDDLNMERGNGILLGATTRDFMAGSAQQTGNPSNLLLEGEGFFTIQDADGNLAYTRDGTVMLSPEGDEMFLVTPQGYYFLDDNGERINVAGATSMQNISVSRDGTVSVITITPATATTPPVTTIEARGNLGIASFTNRKGLDSHGGNLFYASATSGEAQNDTTTRVRQGMLESSNVDMATEMARMIRAQRAFSFASRALVTADEMDGKANQLR